MPWRAVSFSLSNLTDEVTSLQTPSSFGILDTKYSGLVRNTRVVDDHRLNGNPLSISCCCDFKIHHRHSLVRRMAGQWLFGFTVRAVAPIVSNVWMLSLVTSMVFVLAQNQSENLFRNYLCRPWKWFIHLPRGFMWRPIYQPMIGANSSRIYNRYFGSVL